jgi:hypothetical protein
LQKIVEEGLILEAKNYIEIAKKMHMGESTGTQPVYRDRLRHAASERPLVTGRGASRLPRPQVAGQAGGQLSGSQPP